MLKRELKVNFKSFIIWTLILVSLFLVVYLVYPSIINSANIEMMNEMMKMFPDEILKAFNMDLASIDSAFGWLKTEGLVFVMLITGIYSAILGSNILLKEEDDKTIEYLNGLPISRRNIVLNKVFCGLIYITSIVLILGIFNYICLSLSGNFDKKLFILLSITPMLSSLVIFALCLFISTFFHKTKGMLGLSLGIVFASYFINIISELADTTEFLKYLSIFTLADIRNIMVDITINPFMVLISIVLFTALTSLTIIHYERKELM